MRLIHSNDLGPYGATPIPVEDHAPYATIVVAPSDCLAPNAIHADYVLPGDDDSDVFEAACIAAGSGQLLILDGTVWLSRPPSQSPNVIKGMGGDWVTTIRITADCPSPFFSWSSIESLTLSGGDSYSNPGFQPLVSTLLYRPSLVRDVTFENFAPGSYTIDSALRVESCEFWDEAIVDGCLTLVNCEAWDSFYFDSAASVSGCQFWRETVISGSNSLSGCQFWWPSEVIGANSVSGCQFWDVALISGSSSVSGSHFWGDATLLGNLTFSGNTFWDRVYCGDSNNSTVGTISGNTLWWDLQVDNAGVLVSGNQIWGQTTIGTSFSSNNPTAFTNNDVYDTLVVTSGSENTWVANNRVSSTITDNGTNTILDPGNLVNGIWV